MRIVRLLLFVGLVVAVITPGVAMAQTQTQSGTTNVSALVLGPPPADPPTIDEPTEGQKFTTKNIVVRGGCISGLIVKVFTNGDFVGSTVCTSGQFSLNIDLVVGANALTARQYDSGDQPSPTSDTVNVTYALPAPVTPTAPSEPTPASPATPAESGTCSPPFAPPEIEFDYDYLNSLQGLRTNQVFTLPVDFKGCGAPFAVAIEWGPDSTTLASRQDTQTFNAEHSYREAGTYKVVIMVTNRDGQQARIEFILVVAGESTLTFSTPLGPLVLGESSRGAVALFALAMLIPGVLIGSFLFPSTKFSLAKLIDWRKRKHQKQ